MDVDMKRRPKDDRCSQQVQGSLADIGYGTPCVRVPEARDERGDGDAPAASNEDQEDSIEPDCAATSPVRTRTSNVRWQCLLCRADEPAGMDVESADHARHRSLEVWSWTRDREYLSTLPVP